MEKAKIRTNVKIYGSEYLIESDDSEEYVQKVAFYVDKAMKAASAKDIRLSTTLAAVLTAINVADERFKLLDENEKLKTRVALLSESNTKNDALIKRLSADCDAQKKEIDRLKIELAKAHTKLEKT